MGELFVKTGEQVVVAVGRNESLVGQPEYRPATVADLIEAGLGEVVESPLLSGNWPTLSAPGTYLVVRIEGEET